MFNCSEGVQEVQEKLSNGLKMLKEEVKQIKAEMKAKTGNETVSGEEFNQVSQKSNFTLKV